jgi:hypothetical protein
LGPVTFPDVIERIHKIIDPHLLKQQFSSEEIDEAQITIGIRKKAKEFVLPHDQVKQSDLYTLLLIALAQKAGLTIVESKTRLIWRTRGNQALPNLLIGLTSDFINQRITYVNKGCRNDIDLGCRMAAYNAAYAVANRSSGVWLVKDLDHLLLKQGCQGYEKLVACIDVDTNQKVKIENVISLYTKLLSYLGTMYFADHRREKQCSMIYLTCQEAHKWLIEDMEGRAKILNRGKMIKKSKAHKGKIRQDKPHNWGIPSKPAENGLLYPPENRFLDIVLKALWKKTLARGWYEDHWEEVVLSQALRTEWRKMTLSHIARLRALKARLSHVTRKRVNLIKGMQEYSSLRLKKTIVNKAMLTKAHSQLGSQLFDEIRNDHRNILGEYLGFLIDTETFTKAELFQMINKMAADVAAIVDTKYDLKKVSDLQIDNAGQVYKSTRALSISTSIFAGIEALYGDWMYKLRQHWGGTTPTIALASIESSHPIKEIDPKNRPIGYASHKAIQGLLNRFDKQLREELVEWDKYKQFAKGTVSAKQIDRIRTVKQLLDPLNDIISRLSGKRKVQIGEIDALVCTFAARRVSRKN